MSLLIMSEAWRPQVALAYILSLSIVAKRILADCAI